MNPMDILKNLNNFKSQMDVMQGKLVEVKTTGSAGGGIVTIEINGKMEITSVKIDDSMLEKEDLPMLGDLIKAAHTQAMENIKVKIQAELGSEFGLPGGF